MTSKSTPDHDLFGGLSDSDSCENDDNWEKAKSSVSVLQDLEMSCTSDDENSVEEDSQPAEQIFQEEHHYSKDDDRNMTEDDYSSSISTVTPSLSSSSSYDSAQDESAPAIEMNEPMPEVLVDYQGSAERGVVYSPKSRQEWSDLMDAADVMTNVLPSSIGQVRGSQATHLQQYGSQVVKKEVEKPPVVRTPYVTPVITPATSWNQPAISRNQSTFIHEVQAQRRLSENSKEEQIILNKLLVGNFSEEQLDRYVAFKRSKFTRQVIKNVITETTGRPTSDPIAVAVAGLAKLFVGEIVEEAIELRDSLNEQNRPLQPQHIKNAFSKLLQEGKLWPPHGTKL